MSNTKVIFDYYTRTQIRKDFSSLTPFKSIVNHLNNNDKSLKSSNIDRIEYFNYIIKLIDTIKQTNKEDIENFVSNDLLDELNSELNTKLYNDRKDHSNEKIINTAISIILYTTSCILSMRNTLHAELATSYICQLGNRYNKKIWSTLFKNKTILNDKEMIEWFNEYYPKDDFLSDLIEKTVEEINKPQIVEDKANSFGYEKDRIRKAEEFTMIIDKIEIDKVISHSKKNHLLHAIIAYSLVVNHHVSGTDCMEFLEENCKFKQSKDYSKKQAIDIINRFNKVVSEQERLSAIVENADKRHVELINKYRDEIKEILSKANVA